MKRWLGDPDRMAPNPVFSSHGAMRLWSLDRVAAVEATDEWIEWNRTNTNRRAKRSEVGLRAAQRRREETMAAIDALPIVVESHARAYVTRVAVDHYNARLLDREERYGIGDGGPLATVNESAAFLNRITVNYLRHCATNYDADLDALYARVGRVEASARLKRRVLSAIADVYPWLADECGRQATVIE